MYKNASEKHDVTIHRHGDSTFIHGTTGRKEEFSNLAALEKHIDEVMAHDNYEPR